MSSTGTSTRSSPAAGLAGAGSRRPLPGLLLALAVAGIGIGLVGLGTGLSAGEARPVISWLLGFSFWTSILLGSLFFVMIFNLFDAGWSVLVRRQLEHLLAGFKWIAILFLPLLLIAWFYRDPGILWKWLNPEHILPNGYTVANDALYQAKEPYLNKTAFTLRSLLYLGVFLFFANALRRNSFGLDEDGDRSRVQRQKVLSGAGVFACGLALTFAAIDWFMSIEFHWFSTMYGVWFFAASMRAALAFLLILLFFQADRGVLQGLHRPSHNYQLGCIALAFTVFWAYISFSQYFLIYQANIPEETFWYNIRHMNADGTTNSWWWVGLTLIFCNFLLPFLFLLFYKTKVRIPLILFVAAWILTFHVVDLYFNILPSKSAPADNVLNYKVRQFTINFWDVAVFVGIGALVLWAYLTSLRDKGAIPRRDPRIREALEHHE